MYIQINRPRMGLKNEEKIDAPQEKVCMATKKYLNKKTPNET